MHQKVTAMQKEQIIAGLDIGTTKIACLVGRKNEHGKIEIIGMGKSESVGVNRGVVTNIAQTEQSIRQCIEQAAITSGIKIDSVHVGIAGQHIKSLQHRGIRTRDDINMEITQEDIDALIEDMYKLAVPPGEQFIHVLPQEYIVDNEQGIKDPIGMFGARLEANFHIITGQITAARNIYRCVERAGLSVDGLILEPLASADSVLTKEEKEAGVVLVDIGGGTTDVAIFNDGIIRHSAVIPYGGNVITEDIRTGCSILKNQAELLKVKFGSALASESQENEIVCIPGLQNRSAKEISIKNLSSMIQARMEEILELVMYEIKTSGYENKLIGGIVVTGGGSQLKHIRQLVEYVTGFDARVGYPSQHLGKCFSDAIGSPMHATGVGLVMKGFEKTNANADGKEEETTIKGASPEKRVKLFDKFKKAVEEFLNED